MKTAEQWRNDGVTNIASTLHRVDVKEIRAIQIDALREAREIITPECQSMDGEDAFVIAAGIAAALDKLIQDLELR